MAMAFPASARNPHSLSTVIPSSVTTSTNPLSFADRMEYVGTFQMHGGALVFHLFEVLS